MLLSPTSALSMAPHQTPFSVYPSLNPGLLSTPQALPPPERPNISALAKDFNNWHADAAVKHNAQLFLSLESRMGSPSNPVHQDLRFWDNKLSASNNNYPSTEISFVSEPEDRLAYGFAAALNDDHETSMSASQNKYSSYVDLNLGLERSPWRYGLDSEDDAWVPPSFACCTFTSHDFLSTCNHCSRSLAHHDIFMYRGDKAFCSHECRQHQILSDERNSNCPRRFNMIPCIEPRDAPGKNSSSVAQKIIAA